MCTYTDTYMHTFIHVYRQIYTCMYVCMCKHTYITGYPQTYTSTTTTAAAEAAAAAVPDASEMDLHSIAQSFKGQWLSLKAGFLWRVYTVCGRKVIPKRLHRFLTMNTEVLETLDLALNWHHYSSDKMPFLIVQFEIVITVFSGSVNVRTWERILNWLYRYDTRFFTLKEELKITSVCRNSAQRVLT